MTDIRVAVAGAAGRMGRALLGAAAELDGLVCSAALEQHGGSAALGMDSGLMAGCGANGIDLRDDLSASRRPATSGLSSPGLNQRLRTSNPACARRRR